MPKTDLDRIAREFRKLSHLFAETASRNTKAIHVGIDLSQEGTRAGRLLVDAIDAGAFPESRTSANGDWWDRTKGRVPGYVFALGGSFNWKDGESRAPLRRFWYGASESELVPWTPHRSEL